MAKLSDSATVHAQGPRLTWAMTLVASLGGTILGTAGCTDAPADLPSPASIDSRDTIVRTAVLTDLAIDGPAFFMVGEKQDRVFERSASFQIDEMGRLIDPRGRALQGYNASSDDMLVFGDPTTIALGAGTSLIHASSRVDVVGNLVPYGVSMTAFSIDNPTATASFSSVATVYDSNGSSRQIDLYFKQTAASQWTWYAIAEREPDADPVGRNVLGASGQLSFDASGELLGTGTTDSAWTFVGAVPDQKITWNFGPGMHQAAGQSEITSITADGPIAGQRTLSELRIDGALIISQSIVAVAPIFTFQNLEGLASVSPGVYRQTDASGPATMTIGGAEAGSILSGFLEAP